MAASANPSTESTPHPVRIWPGALIVGLQWLMRFAVPALAPELTAAGVIAALLGGVGVVLWWAFFSRVPRRERWLGLVLIVLLLAVTPRLLHVSVATSMQGLMFGVYAAPLLSLALVGWAVLGPRLSAGRRRALLGLFLLLAAGVWTLVRTGGFTGDLDHDFAWRWSATAEERLLADAREERLLSPSHTLDSGASPRAVWPGFRGPGRDGVVRGVRFASDWSTKPPLELWRRPVGPGWSSFAVGGERIYTQEQRGEQEVVACYALATGEPIWRHADTARFWESNGGAGPRGTPSLDGGDVYTLGGTGIVNALRADDGSLLWSRDAAADTGAVLPGWGFAGSPLVLEDRIVVGVAGCLIAYRRDTGDILWRAASTGGGYSSPQLFALDGVEQVVWLSEAGACGVTPDDGTLLWERPWPGDPIVQPAVTADGDVLVTAGDRSGLVRLGVQRGSGGWEVRERWASIRLKPYYNDFVVHQGHAYGLDGGRLVCLDLARGERRWKGGRFGHGQLLLVSDADLLLVVTEAGELALAAASPDAFHELARVSAIEGKTWNHPVVVGDTLFVRNAQEMAAFRLPEAVVGAGTAHESK